MTYQPFDVDAARSAALRVRKSPPTPATFATIATVQAEKPPSVANVATVAGGIRVFEAPSPLGGLPLELVAGLERLAGMPPPDSFDAVRWRDCVHCALDFAENWAAKALALGWTPIELFGLHPAAPDARLDARGVAFALGVEDRVTAITAGQISVAGRNGARLSLRRPNEPGAVLAWCIL